MREYECECGEAVREADGGGQHGDAWTGTETRHDGICHGGNAHHLVQLERERERVQTYPLCEPAVPLSAKRTTMR